MSNENFKLLFNCSSSEISVEQKNHTFLMDMTTYLVY